mmetsp:Transcript_43360/g.139342  ORF Transcript_43360/g.139342 Transcript_43360/m.139342 type:complete len:100 (-) Transcript_43360:651-950(-)
MTRCSLKRGSRCRTTWFFVAILVARSDVEKSTSVRQCWEIATCENCSRFLAQAAPIRDHETLDESDSEQAPSRRVSFRAALGGEAFTQVDAGLASDLFL